VLKEALALPSIARAALADQLLASLELTSPAVDGVWRKEIEARLAAYESGRMEAVPLERVLAKYAAP
jgi:putative addiction module component (TIGR02574 family)